MMGIMLSAFYVYMKAIQYTTTVNRKIIAVVWCLIWAILYSVGPPLIPLPLACLTSIVFIFFLTRQSFEVVASAYLLSFGISCFFYYTANFIISLIYALLTNSEYVVNAPIDYNKPIYLVLHILIVILQFPFAFLLFRIRRLRKGILFIFDKFTIVAALVFAGIILTFATWVHMIASEDVHTSEDVYTGFAFVLGIFIAGIGIYIWIRKSIKTFQKRRMQQNREQYLEKLLAEKDEENKRLKEKVIKLQTVIHKFTHRIESMECAAEWGSNTLGDIQNFHKDFQDELAGIKEEKRLPSTNISTIDNLFKHFARQFAADNINFNVIINGSIVYMVEHIISQAKLETLIGDHLKDAHIAVNESDNPFRSIMAVIGVTGDCYEFTVFDSGIPFEVDTLAQLGTAHVTTHADKGGSGIGFMTTFETMREYNASLVVNEQEKSSADYYKSVSVRFNNKNQYIIETYRPDDFLESERYIVIGHKKQ